VKRDERKQIREQELAALERLAFGKAVMWGLTEPWLYVSDNLIRLTIDFTMTCKVTIDGGDPKWWKWTESLDDLEACRLYGGVEAAKLKHKWNTMGVFDAWESVSEANGYDFRGFDFEHGQVAPLECSGWNLQSSTTSVQMVRPHKVTIDPLDGWAMPPVPDIMSEKSLLVERMKKGKML
jgi:hypothetical protein